MKRSETLSSYFPRRIQSNQSLSETVGTGACHNEQNNPHIELSPDDVVADPRLRKPIEELNVKIRDAARRGYLQLGLCQPSGHKFSWIWPVATTTIERAFSAMSIIKTDLRNKINGEWMNHSMVCYIERDIFASIKDDKILKRFQGMRSR